MGVAGGRNEPGKTRMVSRAKMMAEAIAIEDVKAISTQPGASLKRRTPLRSRDGSTLRIDGNRACAPGDVYVHAYSASRVSAGRASMSLASG